MLKQGRMLALRVKRWCSSNKENLLLYVFLTIMELCGLGVILGAFGVLPPVVAGIGAGLAVLIGLVAAILAIPGNPFSGLWKSTKRLRAVSFSMVTSVIILVVYLLSLSLRNVQSEQINPLVTPRIDPYLHKGILVLDDPLNGSSNKYQWQTTNAVIVNGIDRGSCNFKEQSYQVIILVQPLSTFYCWSQAQSFRDFVYQINIKLINNTGGGIIFRLDSNTESFFYFGINPQGQYVLSQVTNGIVTSLIPDTGDTAISPGLEQKNTLAVVADGTKLSMYINKKYITAMNVNNNGEGHIGVAVVNGFKTTGQANYTNAEVWSLDQP